MKFISSETAESLKYVKVKGAPFRMQHFPDFLIIGPQRTGTTWMAKILWRHPQVFMSFPKELYFFNLLSEPQHRFYRSSQLSWYLRRFRDNPFGYAAKAMRSIVKYGEVYRPLVRGEATASYAALDPSVIAEITKLNPDIKAILMIRNPVTRAWSHAKKDLVRDRGRDLGSVPIGEFERFYRSPYQLRCGDYSTMINNWRAATKEGNLFIGHFDDVAMRPETLLLRVLSFLGVAADAKYIAEFSQVRVNSTEDTEIPSDHKQLLEEIFADEIEALRSSRGLHWPR